jgi:hypothetical protein
MLASIASTFTGVSASRIDMDPAAIDACACACASRVGLRPSHPTGALPA